MTEQLRLFSSRARVALLCAAVLTASADLHGQAAQTVSAIPADTGLVRCVEVPSGAPRPRYGCFNLAHLRGLTFTDTLVVWRLFRFASETAAEAARSPRGSVVEADGAAWLSEISEASAEPPTPSGGVLVTTSAALPLPPAPGYGMSLAFGVFKPGMRSRIHVHAGPEAFYVVAGAQCVVTPTGEVRTAAGSTSFLPAGVAMQLEAAGTEERRAFALIVYDERHPQAEGASWQPSGGCSR